MTKEKIVNYTPELTAELVKGYTEDGMTVEALAEKFGRTARSVIAKLSKEKVYVAKGKTAGKRDMLKSEMVAKIAKLVGRDEEVMESLEKATGVALRAVLEGLETAEADFNE